MGKFLTLLCESKNEDEKCHLIDPLRSISSRFNSFDFDLILSHFDSFSTCLYPDSASIEIPDICQPLFVRFKRCHFYRG